MTAKTYHTKTAISFGLITLSSLFAAGCDSGKKAAIDLAIERTTLTVPLTGRKVDLRSRMAEESPSTRYEWRADETEVDGVYLVSFVQAEGDLEGWGQHWEVDVQNKTVTKVTGNPALQLKYGMSRQRVDVPFETSDLHYRLFEDIRRGGWRQDHKIQNNGIVLTISAEVVNETGKPLVSADLSGSITVQFSEDKVIREYATYGGGVRPEVSENAPWRPGTSRRVSFQTNPIGLIYLDYQPILAIAEMDLTVADPLDYHWEGVVRKVDLDWKRVRGSAVNATGILTERAQLRESPFGSGVSKLREGTEVFVLRERGTWYLLLSPAGVGWVDADSVDVSTESPETADPSAIEAVLVAYRAALRAGAYDEMHRLFTEAAKRATSEKQLARHYSDTPTGTDPDVEVEVRHVFGNRMALARVNYRDTNGDPSSGDYTLVNEGGWKVAWAFDDESRVRELLGEGKFRQAANLAKKLRRVDPFSRTAYIAFAHDSLERNKAGEAEIIAQEVSSLHPDCAECTLLLGSAYYLKGAAEQAEEAIADAQKQTNVGEVLRTWLHRDFDDWSWKAEAGTVLRARPEDTSEAVRRLSEGEELVVGPRRGKYHPVLVLKDGKIVGGTFSAGLRGFTPAGFVARSDLSKK